MVEKQIKNRYIILFLLGICIHSFGQNQANTWYFGNGAGLSFNGNCSPAVLTDGAINGLEGCATISDETTGQLLFYTNSEYVWNRNHLVMPNGNLVSNGYTITQCLIVKKPSADSVYYIITSEVQGYSGQGLQVHEIDLSLNGGVGGIVYKDSLLYPSPLTEKITAVRHANGIDIWLIAHEYNSNKFLSFLITPAGINPTPVISPIGKIHADPSSVDAIGEMKASPNGLKLAVVTSRHPDIELFDFNKITGQVNDPVVLPENGGYDLIGNPSGLYGLSFSSNNKMLYVSKWNLPSLGAPGQIIQFDITSNDSATINSSRVNVFTSTSKSFYSLKLAPDRKIYVGQNVNDYISVINFPDSAGLSCDYVDNGLYLDGKHSSWGLNNLMEYGNYCDNTTGIEDLTSIGNIMLYPNPAAQSTTLLFTMKDAEKVRVTLNDITGKQLMLIADEQFGKGNQKITLNTSTLATGIYICKIESRSGEKVIKLVVGK